MRQIKFRGKRLKDGVWIYGDLVHIERNFEKIVKILDWSMIGDKEKDDDLTVDPATVGQFTGLLDGRGVEIYEGDIVCAIAKAEYPEETIVSDVFCDKNASYQFCVRAIVKGIDRRDITHGLYLMWGGWASLNIIGNIHDNSELLTNV